MERLLIGRVGKAHGVRGEVKVIPETDDPERFDEIETVYVGATAAAAAAYRIERVRYQQSQRGVAVVLKLEGVETREAAEALHQREVYAEETDLPPLGDDEFYLHDLIGLEVVTESGEPVGTVRDVLLMPAQDVYVVSRPGRPDAMIPAVPEFVVGIDLAAGRLVVRPIEGLLD